MDCHL